MRVDWYSKGVLTVIAVLLAQVRHETGRSQVKSFKISSGNRRVYTTFAIELKVFGQADAELPEQ